jgi:hypothetical protein
MILPQVHLRNVYVPKRVRHMLPITALRAHCISAGASSVTANFSIRGRLNLRPSFFFKYGWKKDNPLPYSLCAYRLTGGLVADWPLLHPAGVVTIQRGVTSPAASLSCCRGDRGTHWLLGFPRTFERIAAHSFFFFFFCKNRKSRAACI